MRANFSKSARFDDRSGTRSKKGITRSSKAWRSRNDEHQRLVALAIRLDVATTQPIAYQLENLSPVAVLADVELWNELKPDTARSVVLHRDREASFSVYVTRDVAVQPFLLIVRTRHVVTTVNAWSDVTVSSAGFSEFPAYSRI